MAYYKIGDRIVVDMGRLSGPDNSYAFCRAEASKYSERGGFGKRWEYSRSQSDWELIPDEIAQDNKLLASHLFFLTGEKWTVFDTNEGE